MENELELKAKLAKKIVAIAKEIGAMKMDGRNEFSRYDYHSYLAVNGKLRSLMATYNLAIIPSVTEVNERDFPLKDEKGRDKTVVRSVVKGIIRLVDGDTGYGMDCPWAAADQDVGGKSLGQALTEFVKRFELKLFHISTAGDEDPDSKTTVIGSGVPKEEKPVDWIVKHPELVTICRKNKLTVREVERLVVECDFDEAKVKAKLEQKA